MTQSALPSVSVTFSLQRLFRNWLGPLNRKHRADCPSPHGFNLVPEGGQPTSLSPTPTVITIDTSQKASRSGNGCVSSSQLYPRGEGQHNPEHPELPLLACSWGGVGCATTGPGLSGGERLLAAMEGRNFLADFSFKKLYKFLNLTLSEWAINGSNDTE